MLIHHLILSSSFFIHSPHHLKLANEACWLLSAVPRISSPPLKPAWFLELYDMMNNGGLLDLHGCVPSREEHITMISTGNCTIYLWWFHVMYPTWASFWWTRALFGLGYRTWLIIPRHSRGIRKELSSSIFDGWVTRGERRNPNQMGQGKKSTHGLPF